MVVVLDERDVVVAASKRAREALEGLVEGRPLPEHLPATRHAGAPSGPLRASPAGASGSSTSSEPGDLAAYEELRAGFTAAVSHELRTPLARLLALLETALLPGEDAAELVEQARAEVEQIRELIDDVLFLSELETGREVVSLGSTPVLPVLERGRGRASPSRRPVQACRSASRATRTPSWRCGRECCASSPRTSPRTRSATPGRARLHARPSRDDGASCSRARRRRDRRASSATCRASSSASTGRTARAPRAAPVSASRS